MEIAGYGHSQLYISVLFFHVALTYAIWRGHLSIVMTGEATLDGSFSAPMMPGCDAIYRTSYHDVTAYPLSGCSALAFPFSVFNLAGDACGDRNGNAAFSLTLVVTFDGRYACEACNVSDGIGMRWSRPYLYEEVINTKVVGDGARAFLLDLPYTTAEQSLSSPMSIRNQYNLAQITGRQRRQMSILTVSSELQGPLTRDLPSTHIVSKACQHAM